MKAFALLALLLWNCAACRPAPGEADAGAAPDQAYQPPPLTPAFPERPLPPLSSAEIKLAPVGAPDAGAAADAGAARPEETAADEARRKNSLLGGERGLDHVGIAVAELDAARKAFLDLGFSNPQDGVLPNGIKNVNFYFQDGTYLELLTFYDRNKAPDIARFVERYQAGPMFAVLSVFSAEDTAAFLRQRGFSVSAPRPGRIDPAGAGGKEQKQPMWHTLMFERPALPGDPLFFIAYDRAVRAELFRKLEDESARRAFAHANTVEGLRAIWIAVRDLEAARTAYLRAGLEAGEVFTLPQLSARGVELGAGQGSVLLLTPQEGRGPVAEFLARRGEGLLGLTLLVARLPRARTVIERGSQIKVMAYSGLFGPSLLLTPDRSAGAWLEFTAGPVR